MWVKGGTCKIKESTLCGKTCHWLQQFSWKLMIYAPFILALLHRPWRRILSTFAHTLPAIRADEPQWICVFLFDLIPGEERALPIDSRWEE
jgi:hypothetical protein